MWPHVARLCSMLLFAATAFQCKTTPVQQRSQTLADPSQPGAIKFNSYLDTDANRNQSYLSFMHNQVKPELDRIAQEPGYKVKGASAHQVAYDNSHEKVQKKVDQKWGGIAKVKEIAEELKGEDVTLDTLPGMIHAADKYNLATFIGLASGGGVKIRYADENYALNVHYGVSEQKSGRSFGVGPGRGANDASDKDYLDGLEKYTRGNGNNLGAFYKVAIEALLATDTRGYKDITDEGQAVMTDFLAVYTAEQDRNLMDGHVTQHWDAALLEVTLLAGFHANQTKMKLYYRNPQTQETGFTQKVIPQTRCEDAPPAMRDAKLRDYWQFSRRIHDTNNCGRSGINITKDEFRLLGRRITEYVKDKKPALVTAIQSSLNDSNVASKNVYNALSAFLLHDIDAKETYPAAQVKKIADAYVAFILYVHAESKKITKWISDQDGEGAVAGEGIIPAGMEPPVEDALDQDEVSQLE